MFPHERSLVKKLADRPFVLLGVNSDREREKLKQDNEKQQITWRSFLDKSTSGPISQQYAVRGWPTLYVLDTKGVIRHKWLGSPGDNVLDEAIEKLVKEAEEGAKK